MAYIKEEIYDAQTTASIAEHYREILRLLGEDPEREGLVKTPERVAKALQFLTHGAQQDGAGNPSQRNVQGGISADGPGQGH